MTASATGSTSTTRATRKDDVTYTIRFKTHQKSGKDGVSSFLYNNGPITTVNDANVARAADLLGRAHQGRRRPRRSARACAPCRPTSARAPRPTTRRWPTPASTALSNGGKAYAGPRDDAFFVDLGSIFDLGGLRPFNTLHVIPLDTEPGVDGVAGYNTASIVLQVPISEVRQSAGQPVVGVWASADRKATKEISTDGKVKWSGPWVQVSRLGDPLINEVIIPRHLKDYWNGQPPSKDSQFLKYYEAPELAGLDQLPVPGAR